MPGRRPRQRLVRLCVGSGANRLPRRSGEGRRDVLGPMPHRCARPPNELGAEQYTNWICPVPQQLRVPGGGGGARRGIPLHCHSPHASICACTFRHTLLQCPSVFEICASACVILRRHTFDPTPRMTRHRVSDVAHCDGKGATARTAATERRLRCALGLKSESPPEAGDSGSLDAYRHAMLIAPANHACHACAPERKPCPLPLPGASLPKPDRV